MLIFQHLLLPFFLNYFHTYLPHLTMLTNKMVYYVALSCLRPTIFLIEIKLHKLSVVCIDDTRINYTAN